MLLDVRFGRYLEAAVFCGGGNRHCDPGLLTIGCSLIPDRKERCKPPGKGCLSEGPTLFFRYLVM